jgi:hypothetical protein
MRRLDALSASLLLATAACTGTVVDHPGTGGSTTTTGTTSSGPGGSSASGGTGGGGGTSVTLTLDTFTVPPGGEVYYCQDFANPFGGVDAEVSEFESHMSVGSHHMLLFYKPGATDSPLAACSGLEFAATPYGSQTQNDSLSFPPGIAALVPGSDGLRIQSHYLNITADTITSSVKVTLHLAEPGSVQYQAGVLFVIDTGIDVAPESSAVVSDDCTLPIDMNMLRASSHMHEHGTAFDAMVSGETVYQTNAWSDPVPALFAPPKVLQAGAPLHFQCSFTNNGTVPLTFGESALTDEMCIFTASFYPTPAGQATIDASNCVATQN